MKTYWPLFLALIVFSIPALSYQQVCDYSLSQRLAEAPPHRDFRGIREAWLQNVLNDYDAMKMERIPVKVSGKKARELLEKFQKAVGVKSSAHIFLLNQSLDYVDTRNPAPTVKVHTFKKTLKNLEYVATIRVQGKSWRLTLSLVDLENGQSLELPLSRGFWGQYKALARDMSVKDLGYTQSFASDVFFYNSGIPANYAGAKAELKMSARGPGRVKDSMAVSVYVVKK